MWDLGVGDRNLQYSTLHVVNTTMLEAVVKRLALFASILFLVDVPPYLAQQQV
jgi:hypothetical protein